MAFIKVGKTRNVNLKLLLVFAMVSALIFPIAASGQFSVSSNWDDLEELELIRVIGGSNSELFLDPTDIAIGESGNIYVADYGNKRIQILDSLGQLVQTIELKGSPHGITLDKDENIYVTEWWDFIGVEKFTKTGEPATDFQIKDQSAFGLPSDVVLDSNGVLYVLEHRNLDIDYGENAGAALLTRAISEMMRISIALGGKKESIFGLSGVGDILLTCTSKLSRNFALGIDIGQGEKIEKIIFF